VWLPRFRRLVAGVDLAAEHCADAAIAAAHAVGGPGGMARHWLRVAPAEDGVAEVLREADAEWVRLWCRLAGCPPPVESSAVFADLHARLFGVGSACLGHLSASDVAEAAYARGLADAWPTVHRWAAAMGADWRVVAAAAGVGAGPLGQGADAHSVAAHLKASAEALESAFARGRRGAAARATHGDGPGARSSPESDAAGRPNLWVSALGSADGGLAGRLAPARAAGFVVARALGLPVWPSLSVPRPPHCRRCLAPVISEAVSRDGDGTGGQRAVGAVADAFGEHLLCCPRAGVLAGAKRRHDAVVRALADVSFAAGCEGRYHDGPVFTFGRRLRPADLMQRAPGFPAGLCVDFTVGSRQVAGAAAREAFKARKFAAAIAAHPHLGFAAFGADLSGELGPSAEALVGGWCRALAAQRAHARVPLGDVRGEVTVAVARAFTRAAAEQAVACMAAG
jgi:hypothetical protein